MVRDLAVETGKNVRLLISGETTEVDKTVVEQLFDPLIHMIRNAVDHGIESPDERSANGKPAQGTVRLSAVHIGGRIVIQVTDDGRGIDRVRVRARAVERGLLDADAVLTEEQLDNLIFLPGLSTAETVSDISGRGVGMDVVRRNVERLGGRVMIRSVAGRGSTFYLSLPLTLARATPATAWKDPSPHTVSFVNADQNVKLEVLDWGGPSTGRTLVLVPGLGNTAHIFDVLATKLTARYHVVGVTRRGFGDSSAPASGYGADRLGDDVLAVIDALKISQPVLAGHSLGGEELSSIGSRHPEKVAGLIYLDAGYSYAFYAPDIEPFPPPPTTPLPPIIESIMTGTQKYTSIPVPILAIYALPHDPGAAAPAAMRAQTEANDVKGEAQARAFERGVPTARVVRVASCSSLPILYATVPSRPQRIRAASKIDAGRSGEFMSLSASHGIVIATGTRAADRARLVLHSGVPRARD
jgi:pimeloyl-ACP methyl ester carboxylesterase/anti-sigma regulatory factor (Ser/Thr protein kinase)